jgi:hypothetical protein
MLSVILANYQEIKGNQEWRDVAVAEKVRGCGNAGIKRASVQELATAFRSYKEILLIAIELATAEGLKSSYVRQLV